MYKNIFFLVIVLIILFILINYLKCNILYLPTPASPQKYDRFISRLQQLSSSENKNNVKNFYVRTDDGIFLDTIYLKNPDTKKCIIFFHGNGGNIAMRFDMIKFLYNYASVIVFDYRSFGRSTYNNSALSSTDLQRDADAIWDYTINTLNIDANNICLFGESLGCSIAIYLAAKLSQNLDERYYPYALILNSPFYSLSNMIKLTFAKINLTYIGYVISWIFGREYQSNEWMSLINSRIKIIIAHSPRDEIIPFSEGKLLFEIAQRYELNAKFILLTGTHNDVGLTDNYIYALAEIFNNST